MITIMLADDHKIVRQGIKALLKAETDFEITGEASDGFEAVKLAERLKPDIMVVDLSMPGLNGFEVTVWVHKHLPETGIVILSMHNAEAYVLRAFEVGAIAYVIKESGLDELAHAIREAIAGHRYLSPPLSELSLEAYQRKVTATAGPLV